MRRIRPLPPSRCQTGPGGPRWAPGSTVCAPRGSETPGIRRTALSVGGFVTLNYEQYLLNSRCPWGRELQDEGHILPKRPGPSAAGGTPQAGRPCTCVNLEPVRVRPAGDADSARLLPSLRSRPVPLLRKSGESRPPGAAGRSLPPSGTELVCARPDEIGEVGPGGGTWGPWRRALAAHKLERTCSARGTATAASAA